jgi:hypothetical protein
MDKPLTFNKIKLTALYAFLLLCFVMGAPLQMLGILSPTETNYLAIFALIICFTLRKRLSICQSNITMLALLLYVTLIALINKTPPSYLLVYYYYLLCPILVFKAAKTLSQKNNYSHQRVITYCNYFLLVQLFFAVLQTMAGDQIASFSKIPLEPIDAVSGTFFIKSDASLSIFALLVFISAFSLTTTTKLKFATLLISGAVISLTNSKATHGLAIIIVSTVLFYSIFLQGRLAAGKKALAIILATIAVALLWTTLTDKTDEILNVFQDAYYSRYDHEEASRLAPIGEAIHSNIYWLGKGLLAYYNPLNKTWDYYSGFSLIYSFYLDCGLIGLLLILYFFVSFTIENIKDNFYRIVYLACIICFSTFNLILTDLAFLFTLSFLYFTHKKELRTL